VFVCLFVVCVGDGGGGGGGGGGDNGGDNNNNVAVASRQILDPSLGGVLTPLPG
jgi:hypothetical protein